MLHQAVARAEVQAQNAVGILGGRQARQFADSDGANRPTVGAGGRVKEPVAQNRFGRRVSPRAEHFGSYGLDAFKLGMERLHHLGASLWRWRKSAQLSQA